MRGGDAVNQGQSIWLPSRHDLEDLDRVADYCSERYFHQPNYWKVEGKPFFAIYEIYHLATQLGGKDQAREALVRMDRRARKNGLPGLYFSAQVGCCDDNLYCCGYDRPPDARAMGYQSVFAYNIARTPRFSSLPNDMPLVPYDDVMASHQHCWREIEKHGVPHHPVVTVGCDVTPRWHRGVTLPMDFRALPYEPIVVDNTPEKFGALCALALKQVRTRNPPVKSIIINAWNEWTEGMYLLPEQRYGTGYLEAVRDAMKT